MDPPLALVGSTQHPAARQCSQTSPHRGPPRQANPANWLRLGNETERGLLDDIINRQRGGFFRLGSTIRVQRALRIPVHRGQSFRRIADSIPVIADSF
jgi:hypothetical protein